jgi:hypothetical protein
MFEFAPFFLNGSTEKGVNFKILNLNKAFKVVDGAHFTGALIS